VRANGSIAKLGHLLRTFPESSINHNIIIAPRNYHNDFHNTHPAAIELLEVYITAHKAAESRNKIAINIPPFQSFLNPSTTYLDGHTRRASR
jgi:hypothetical protein